MPQRAPLRAGVLWGAVSLGLLLAIPSTASARKPITGKLSDPGYTVLALKANGKATSVRATPKFRLKPPARVATLHLIKKNGTYGGPIVLATKEHGKRAIVGVKPGARLGPITVKASKGYAKAKHRPPERFLDADRYAQGDRAPIGAGNFGRVRSGHTHGGVPGDLDLDGIPEALDIDDDGDRVLDHLDRTPTGHRARLSKDVTGCGPDNFYCQPVAFGLAPGLQDTVNVNAGSTLAQIDATLVSNGGLRFGLRGDSVELDCGGSPDPDNPNGWIGGLSYCTRGGTGSGTCCGGPSPPFPECCDTDDDGFGTLEPMFTGTDSFISPKATSDQIKTGDVLTERVTTDGTETQLPGTLNFVFVTIPALVSVSDAASPANSATVTYPIAPGDPGTSGSGFLVDGAPCPSDAPPSCVDGDVVVTLTLWKPQRRAIPGSDPDTADWMDLGGLKYAAYAPEAGHPALGGGCPQNTFSSSDPDLVPPSLPLLGTGSLEDLQADKVASPSNTVTFKLDLSKCLAANSLSFNSGQERSINFMAVSGATDTTEQQGFAFKRK